jgi:tellurite resistance protein TerC
LKVGLLGAYLGRGLMLFIASWVIRNQWLLLLGGLYLVKLGVDHLGDTPMEVRAAAAKAAGRPLPKAGRTFWGVVVAVEMADLAFSLDNVVAAVALSREFWVVMTGVALGIVTMRFAAGIFVYLIERFPVLEAAAYLLVLSIGAGLLAEDFLGWHPSHVQRFFISFTIVVGTLLYGQSPALRRIGRRFAWLRRVLGYIDLLFIYALRPLAWIGAGIVAVVRTLAQVMAVRPRLTDAERVEEAIASEAVPDPKK